MLAKSEGLQLQAPGLIAQGRIIRVRRHRVASVIDAIPTALKGRKSVRL